MNIFHVKRVLFCIGVGLTLWRSYECFEKYLYSNLSTKVSMLKSSETFMPSLVICPSYFSAYNQRYTFVKHLLFNQYFRNLELIGIQKPWDYRLGEWFGNSSSSGYQIFRDVTHNLSDLLKSSRFSLQTYK